MLSVIISIENIVANTRIKIMHSCHKNILTNEIFLTLNLHSLTALANEKFYMRINKMGFCYFKKMSLHSKRGLSNLLYLTIRL